MRLARPGCSCGHGIACAATRLSLDRTQGWCATAPGVCVLKRLLGWAGAWLAVATLLGGCRDPGPGAAPTTPGQSLSGGTGSATLSWEAPTTNSDGTALMDLAGYRIYYGSSAEHLDHTVNIGTVGVQTYVIEGLGPGNWYFAVMALAADGAESGLSDLVVKTIT